MIANQLVLKVITNLYVIPRLPAWSKNTLKKKELKRKIEKQKRAQREDTEAAVCAARERSTAEKDKYLRQQRELQAQIEAARRKQQEQETTINTLQEKLRRM